MFTEYLILLCPNISVYFIHICDIYELNTDYTCNNFIKLNYSSKITNVHRLTIIGYRFLINSYTPEKYSRK